jgi:serine/threonine protein kinase
VAGFRRECALLGGLSHENIIGLIGICLSPLCMITELASGGDLTRFLAQS